jgi:hypothetical protein
LVDRRIAAVLFAKDAGIDAGITTFAVAARRTTRARVRIAGLSLGAADVAAFPIVRTTLVVDARLANRATLAKCSLVRSVAGYRTTCIAAGRTTTILLGTNRAVTAAVVGSPEGVTADVIDWATFIRDEADTQLVTRTTDIATEQVRVCFRAFPIIAALAIAAFTSLLDRIGRATSV